MATKTLRTTPRSAYLHLIRRFPLRPLRSRAELDEAVAVLDSLVDRMPLQPQEQDYLRVLGELVRKYEEEHLPIPRGTDSEILRFLMEANGLNQSRLAREIGLPISVLSDMLRGKRRLTRAHIGKLVKRFKLQPHAFVF
ncbi:MAG: type II toxin-antitoxin system HigA family antitoxin [Gemmataceae bacterium]